MAATVGTLIINCSTDENQASYEAAVCLGEYLGGSDELAVFDFCKDEILEDTVS